MRTGVANLPLHSGRAPAWLFKRMKELAREISIFVVTEFGPDEMLTKLSDPFWFQAFGCVLGFDWHSSGVTTTVCGALKEGLKGLESDLGLFVAGGKGGTSRKTPSEIENFCGQMTLDAEGLVYASKMSAKVDSAAVQDGFQLYHHCFVFTKGGLWTVVQQGMSDETGYARRYHWHSTGVDDFVCEPHSAICCDTRTKTLNMVAEESDEARGATAQAATIHPDELLAELKKVQTLDLPRHHQVLQNDLDSTRIRKTLISTFERQPENFETLLGLQGVGPKTVRSLSLVAELIFGAQASFRDPARFSFAHGGKDGHPYPVDRENYDLSIDILRQSLSAAKVGHTDKVKAFKRLARFENE